MTHPAIGIFQDDLTAFWDQIKPTIRDMGIPEQARIFARGKLLEWLEPRFKQLPGGGANDWVVTCDEMNNQPGMVDDGELRVDIALMPYFDTRIFEWTLKAPLL